MCGRYVVYTDAEYAEMNNIVRDVERQLRADEALKTGEIFPTDLAPVVRMEGGGAASVPMVWGFPRWNGGGVVINARAETAAEKKMFRAAAFSRRLVVPSTGFFEWKRTDGRRLKDKYLLRLPGAPMLYMAGLFNLYRQPDGGERGRFVILTTAASQSVSALHDRMPVILGPEETGAWLHDGAAAGHILARPGPELILEKVS
jgi:putative SOS response-associated peptidase YedK